MASFAICSLSQKTVVIRQLVFKKCNLFYIDKEHHTIAIIILMGYNFREVEPVYHVQTNRELSEIESSKISHQTFFPSKSQKKMSKILNPITTEMCTHKYSRLQGYNAFRQALLCAWSEFSWHLKQTTGPKTIIRWFH